MYIRQSVRPQGPVSRKHRDYLLSLVTLVPVFPHLSPVLDLRNVQGPAAVLLGELCLCELVPGDLTEHRSLPRGSNIS